MYERKRLSNSRGFTQSSYRQSVSETVRGLQRDMTDEDMAGLWGVSDGTVLNARNRNHDLNGFNLLKLGERFGTEGLSTIFALIGMKVVDERMIEVDPAEIPCEVAECVPELIRALSDGHCSTADTQKLDQAGVIDKLITIADHLRQHRDRIRLVA
jgi:hypothetical protein